MLHVCSLAALPDTVKATGASHVLTVMANVEQVQRPVSVLPAHHLKVSMDDITEQMDGFVAPCEQHIEKVLAFVRGWDRSAPMVVHCYAGISRSTASVPASTPLSIKISKELAARGFKFVRPTIVYAFMQATGMVNDHLTTCFCHENCSGKLRKPRLKAK